MIIFIDRPVKIRPMHNTRVIYLYIQTKSQNIRLLHRRKILYAFIQPKKITRKKKRV